MKSVRTIFAIDSHTMGEPLRLVVGGFPNLIGDSITEKRTYFQEHYDYLRKAIMQEPRGHKDMFGAILTPPTMKEADVGVIFMHGEGFHNMCGHGTIAVNTILVETGMVEVTEPVTTIKMEAPAGLVTVHVKVEDKRAKEVSFENVPSFLYKENISLEVPDYGNLNIDIAFGGSFFVLINSKQLGIDICPQNSSKLIDAGMKILEYANKAINISHPLLPHIKTIDLCEIYGEAKTKGAHMQNITVFDGQIDRSPCGTGTSAKVAALWAKGELKLGEEFIYESVIGTLFKGKALRETTVGSFKAIIPEITGSAYITGTNQFLIDDDDPIKYGFELK